ncbi:MAG: 2-oxoacid:acceptor oxidoreductase subunit alpha, partial [Deltaproteobacteria bacterium]|nr:2-oxoacid:acceptor oxidoreductase subunit alpha [Deltaproteobacteria bacterium]
LVSEYDLERVVIDRGQVAPEPDQPGLLARYRLTESGISPRAYAGCSRWIVQQDSHEHTEIGRLSDDRENRVVQFDKRRRKGDGLAAVFPGPEIHGDDDGLLLLCWGSTAGPLREASERLRAEGARLGVAVFRYLFPLDCDLVTRSLAAAKLLVTVEMNSRGQLGALLQMECGIRPWRHLGSIDGRCFTVDDLYRRVREVM